MKRRSTTVKVEVLAEKLKCWMLKDSGPFGWNDPADFQDRFEAFSQAERLEFARVFADKCREVLTLFAKDGKN